MSPILVSFFYVAFYLVLILFDNIDNVFRPELNYRDVLRLEPRRMNEKKNVFSTQPANVNNTDAKPAKEHMYTQQKKEKKYSLDEKVIFAKTKCMLRRSKKTRNKHIERRRRSREKCDLDHRETRYEQFYSSFAILFHSSRLYP